MMRGDRRGASDIEIIEVFDVTSPGGAWPPSAPVGREDPAEAPRRGWRLPLLGLGICGAVLAAMLWPNGEQAATPATTTTARPTTTTERSASEDIGGFRLMPATPAGYRAVAVRDSRERPPEGMIELWRPPFTRFEEAGTWTMAQYRPDPPSFTGDRRVLIGDRVAVLGDHLGVRTLVVRTPDGGRLQIWERGNDEDLIADAEQVTVLPDDLGGPAQSITMNLEVSTADGGGDVTWAGSELAIYHFWGAAGPFAVSVGEPQTGVRERLNEFLMGRRATLSDGTPVRYGLTDPERSSLAMQTIVHGQQVTISGRGTIEQFIAVAESMHLAGEQEWDDLDDEARVERGLEFSGQPQPIGAGMLADGTAWAVGGQTTSTTYGGVQRKWTALRLSAAPLPGAPESGVESYSVSDAADAPQITSYADRRATYLVALLPSTVPEGTVLRVQLDNGAVTEVPVQALVQLRSGSAAAHAFSEIVGWSAQVVDPSGQILASASG